MAAAAYTYRQYSSLYKYNIDTGTISLYTTGMGTVRDARGVLAIAEGSLRQLMETALREQRYADVAGIAGLADGVARLIQGDSPDRDVAPQELAPSAAMVPCEPVVPSPKISGKSTKSTYPRFQSDGDKLVKIGWSKTNKSAYEHRAPREAVVAFARHLTANVVEGKVFSMEDLLPVPDVANGGEIPAYQAYLTLGWLRSVGAVAKKGRDGYVLRHGGLANGALDKFWSSLSGRD
jgi:hypothetical protein